MRSHCEIRGLLRAHSLDCMWCVFSHGRKRDISLRPLVMSLILFLRILPLKHLISRHHHPSGEDLNIGTLGLHGFTLVI